MQSNNNIKIFLIKLFSITIAIIVIINVTYNLILADKIETINKIFLLSDKENLDNVKNKIRLEIKKGLQKEKILSDEDKKILIGIIKKIKSELKE